MSTTHDEILAERGATEVQARADSAYRHALGCGAPPRLSGESLPEYRIRLVDGLRGFSERWKRIDRPGLAGVARSGALGVAEEQVYADAVQSVRRNTGPLRKVTEVDSETGSRITRFYGDPHAWLDDFSLPTRRLTGINTKGNRR